MFAFPPCSTCLQSSHVMTSQLSIMKSFVIFVLVMKNVESFGGPWYSNSAPFSCRRELVERSSNAFARKRYIGKGSTTIRMGLFDGIKEAFAAPALERSVLDAERETPIDRWMGWSVRADETVATIADANNKNFVDSMDEANYICASLTKPMGILFEENDAEFGGIFVLSLTETSVAQGTVKPGLQLIAVNEKKVAGLSFEEALGAIKNSEEEQTLLTFFQGEAKQFYGPTGPSQAWLDEFVAKMNKSSSSTSVPSQ